MGRIRVRRSRGPRHGVSFLELLIVVGIVAALTGIASMYYRNLMDEANRERARADMRSIAKAIVKLEADTKVTIRPDGPHFVPATGKPSGMEPPGIGVNDGGFTLDRLLDFRIMVNLPDDPYGFQYQIDIPEGVLYSTGPDGLDQTGDEVRLRFRPRFVPKRAHFTNGRAAILVEFSRKVDPFSLFAETPADLPFTLTAAAAVSPTTAARHITNPFAAIVRLDQTWDPVANGEIRVSVISDPSVPKGVQAMDTAFLAEYPNLVVQDEY